MIQAILFDLGDTIIDFGVGRAEAEPLFRRGAKLTYEHLVASGRSMGTFKRYFRAHYRCMQRAYVWSKIRRRDFSYGSVLRKVAGRLKLHVSEHEFQELAWLWYQPILQASHIDAGVRGMLEQLRSAGTKLAIVSNTVVPGHCLDRHLEQEGLLEFFPIRVYSSDTRYRKPHPRIFQIALEKVGAKPERTVFVGDLLQTDIVGARRSGMKTIWKPARHAKHAHPGKHKPDLIIRRITQLPEVLPQIGWNPGPHHKPAPLVGSAA